jgi:peptidyl-Lys metalloendopeptidase
MQRALLIKLLVSILGFLALAPALCLAAIPPGIAVTIAPTKASFGPREELMVTVSYANVTDSDIRLLKWGTGLDGRIGPNIVDLKFEGRSLAYTGILVKRLPPTESDFVILSANKTLSAKVSLDLSYAINLQGQYLMEPKDRRSQTAQLKSTANAFRLSADRPVFRLKRPAAFTECTVEKKNQLTAALGAAESISRVARDAIRNTSTNMRITAPRHQEWFGAYDLGRWDRTQVNFDNIYNATANKTVGFDCSCDDPGIDDPDNTFAYVSSTDHYNMNICGAFWRAPLLGKDSRAGTIVHELSHFNVVAATDDIQYGQNAARSLAKSNPGNAIQNADSHEYFAENTPFLSMPGPGSVFPDLVFASSTISNSSPSVKVSVLVSGTIVNQGDGDASSTQLSLSLSIPPSNPIIITKAIPALGTGESLDFQIDFDAPDQPGEYTLELCISAVSNESNTGNNCLMLPQLVVRNSSVIAPILLLLLDE